MQLYLAYLKHISNIYKNRPPTVIIRDFKSPLSVINRSIRKKISKAIFELKVPK